jgi:hypothetical protein
MAICEHCSGEYSVGLPDGGRYKHNDILCRLCAEQSVELSGLEVGVLEDVGRGTIAKNIVRCVERRLSQGAYLKRRGRYVISDLYLTQDGFLELREALWSERDVAGNSTRREILNRLGDEIVRTFSEFYPLVEF